MRIEQLSKDFAVLAARLRMVWKIHDAAARPRVLVAVSKQAHCLKSLLHRWEVGTLPIEVFGVVSNHETQRRLAEWHRLPFHHLPIESGRKEHQEEQLLALFDELKADLLVLARYMQILSAAPVACSPAAPSTFITRSCRASRARNPITKHISAA